MSDHLLLKDYLHRSHDLEASVEEIMLESRHAQRAHDLDAVIPDCVDLEALTGRAWTGLLALALDEQRAGESVVVEQAFRGALARTISIFSAVGKAISHIQNQGHAIDRAVDFSRALQRLQAIRQEIDQDLPEFTAEMIAEGRSELQQGLAEDLETVLARLTTS